MTDTRPETRPDEEAADWLADALRSARQRELDDGGFSDGVLARIAGAPSATDPLAMLSAARQHERRERVHGRWSIVGVLAGAAVAWLSGLGAHWPVSMAPTAELFAPGFGLLIAASAMAYVALSSASD
jgi:hypothetical protein